MRRFVLPVSLALLAAVGMQAQRFTTAPCNGDQGGGSSGWFFGHEDHACELRRTVLPLVNGQVNVEGRNGAIEVVGEDRRDVALEARVTAQAGSHDEAESILRQVKILTDGTIRADGPSMTGWFGHGWAVSYRLRVPRHVAAHLRTLNGGLSIADVAGSIDVATTNGGLTLNDLAGDVHASTVNGGVNVRLAGDRWQGAGLLAKSTNGGVTVGAQRGYSAHLIVSTVNGGIAVNFPTNTGITPRRHLETDMGHGGSTVQFETVNGGVTISEAGPSGPE